MSPAVTDATLPAAEWARSRDGTTIAYYTLGSGPSVLMVPGALSTASDYMAFAELSVTGGATWCTRMAFCFAVSRKSSAHPENRLRLTLGLRMEGARWSLPTSITCTGPRSDATIRSGQRASVA